MVAVVGGAVGSELLGIPWHIGAMIGILAMAGDLISSFVKRRVGMPPSSRATGLDQVPEALLPLLACQVVYGLRWWDLLWMVAVFTVVEILLSRLLFRWYVRDRPY